ncbi:MULTISPECIES: hypothetical protein [Chitinophagaceae]
MKMQLTVLLFIVNLLSISVFARENPYVDSLKTAIKKQKGDARFYTYFRLVDNYRMNDRTDEAVKSAYVYKTLAKNENNILETVKAYALLCHIYTNREAYKMAQLFQDSAVLAAGDSPHKLVRAYANYAKLVFYYGIQDNEMLAKLAQETLILVESGDDDSFLKGRCYYFLYAVNTNFEDYGKSYRYAANTITEATKAQEMNLLASGYMALSTAFTYKYDADQEALYLDSIMYYTRLAGDAFFLYPGKVANHTYYMAKLNEASFQLKYYYPKQPWIAAKILGSVRSVLHYIEHNEDFGKEDMVADCYGMMAAIDKDRGNYGQAMSYLKTAWRIVDSAKYKDYYYAKNNLLIEMANVYAAQNDYKSAFETQNDLFLNNAKLFDERRSKMVNQLEAQYQAERKEREVLVLREQARTQKHMQYLYLSLAVIGMGGMFFMFRAYHFKLKYSLEHRKKLEMEKNDAHSRILLQEEEQARLKAEQELLELQQQKLRDEVMMSQLQVQHKNEVLLNLKEKLNDTPVNIQQIIREENLLDSDFENAKFRIQTVHPHFFKTLNE